MRRAVYIVLGLGMLLSAGCHRRYAVQGHTSHNYAVSDSVGKDTLMQRFVQTYSEMMDDKMGQVVGYTDTTLLKQLPEGELGLVVAQAQMIAARKVEPQVHASIVNYGGIRISRIDKGAITLGKLHELLPFDNTIVILRVPGAVMLQWCNHMAALRGWPVSGMRYTIKNGHAENISIAGNPIDTNAVYNIATNDYLAEGGDDCSFLKPLTPVKTFVVLRDAVIEQVEKLQAAGKPLRAEPEETISYE